MAKKPTPSKSKAKVVKKTKKAPKVEAKKPTGMWKILEQKQMHLKEMEMARLEGRAPTHTQGQAFHANPRDPRFTKFAGPRRKAG